MEKKYKIGYTTGVFDMFHIGHLRILERAKAQCEYLIVGVSTDELVMEYKGKLPVIKFEERYEIIKAIKYVDEVIPQTSMNKLEMWEKYHFNALFHGSDWKNSTMYNELIVELGKRGADVVFLPHTEGISSTQLSDKVENRIGES